MWYIESSMTSKHVNIILLYKLMGWDATMYRDLLQFNVLFNVLSILVVYLFVIVGGRTNYCTSLLNFVIVV